MICKEKFVECVNVLRNYYNWYNKLFDIGITIESPELGAVADTLYEIILNGDFESDYDEYAGVSWIANWCGSPLDQKGFRRMYDWIIIEDAGALYDFVSEMKQLGWPERTPDGWKKEIQWKI